MNLDLRPPRWRWLSRSMYAYFALWLSVWLDRGALATLASGLIAGGALLASSAPDVRSMREAAASLGSPLAGTPLPTEDPLADSRPSSRGGGTGTRPVFVMPAASAALPSQDLGEAHARQPAGGRIALVVVDLDQTAFSRQLQRLIGASAALRMVDVGLDFGRGHDLLRQGRVQGLLVLPEHLQAAWLGASLAEPVQLELSSGGGPLGRQRALVAALEQVLDSLPATQVQADAGGAVVARPPAGAERLGLRVHRQPDGAEASGGSVAPRPGSPLQAAPAAEPARSQIGLDLVPLRQDDQDSPASALLDRPWLPALLALPAVQPATALLIVQQTLLVVLCMLFSHWTQQRAWPVRRTWSSWLGVWLAVVTLALIGCGGHLLPGWWAGWFDPVPGADLLALLAVLLLYALSLAALAIWVASLLRQREGGLIGLALLTLPLLTLASLPSPLQGLELLAGADGRGGWGAVLAFMLQALAWLLPATSAGHALTLVVDLGASWPELAGDLAILAALGGVSLAAGLRAWREPLAP